jgi:PAS domain-containing protein
VSDIAASDIVETVPSALLILDRNLNISSANRAFYQTFRTSPDETEGCLIYDLGNRQWDIPALRTLLESVIPHRASVEGFEVEHNFPTIGRRTMPVNARKIFRPANMTALFFWPSRMSAKSAPPARKATATGR